MDANGGAQFMRLWDGTPSRIPPRAVLSPERFQRDRCFAEIASASARHNAEHGLPVRKSACEGLRWSGAIGPCSAAATATLLESFLRTLSALDGPGRLLSFGESLSPK
jgi:hypothetical protein